MTPEEMTPEERFEARRKLDRALNTPTLALREIRELKEFLAKKDAALLAAGELAEIMANPVRSDDGLYDYYQADIDAALANWSAISGGAGNV